MSKLFQQMLEKEYGISYEDFFLLDCDTQQNLIQIYRRKVKKDNKKNTLMMFGLGEHTIFKRVKKGSKVMIGSGEHATFVETGLTLEEARKRLNTRERKIIGLDKDIMIQTVKTKILSKKKKYK